MLSILKNYMNYSDLPFLPERMEINKCKQLVCNLYDKKKICSTHELIKTSIKSWIKVKKKSIESLNLIKKHG